MFARFLFSKRWSERSPICQSRVSIRDAQDSRRQRNLLALQSVRITRTVPPFLMPADEELRATVCAGAGRFTFADQRMTRQIKALFGRERPRALDVITLHRDFAHIMRERR